MRIAVIVNPTAGKPEPVLATINRRFAEHDVEWELAVTTPERDADALAAASRGADVVAVYGGDGTVSLAANGLVGCDTPLAILPGGTCNVIARELEIPEDLDAALALACRGPALASSIDTMKLGDAHKLIRVGVGIDAKVIQESTRARKDELGWLAYLFAAIEQISSTTPVKYTVELDGDALVTDACACVIANIGRVGRGGLQLPGQLSPFDGQLDVVMLRGTNFPLIRTFYSGVFGVTAPLDLKHDNDAPVVHCRGTRVRVSATPAQPVQADGDLLGETPIDVSIVPASLRVIIPEDQHPDRAR